MGAPGYHSRAQANIKLPPHQPCWAPDSLPSAETHVLGVVVVHREADSAELTDLGRYAIRRVRGMAQPGDPVLQLRVTLADVDWPRGVAAGGDPAGYTLGRVHGVIQAATGWQNPHLHMFRIADREYGPPRIWTMSSRRSARSGQDR
jgi:hypothetical protein